MRNEILRTTGAGHGAIATGAPRAAVLWACVLAGAVSCGSVKRIGFPDVAVDVRQSDVAYPDAPGDLPFVVRDVPNGKSDAVDVLPVDGTGADGVTLDAPAADAEVVDAAAACSEIPTPFGCPCLENEECGSGWCVPHLGGRVCTRACELGCPAGFSCGTVGGGGQDFLHMCVSDAPTLCMPCRNDTDCGNLATGQTGRCARESAATGSFCGAACERTEDCPGGYECREVTMLAGDKALQCMPLSGECECTGLAVSLALSTGCAVTNANGTCTGNRTCTADGLTPCDAPSALKEVCDGTDNDCDGGIDEGVSCDDANECTQDQCKGAAGCVNAPLDGTSCYDGTVCTESDHCSAGKCVGKPIVCDDGNPCTDDGCDADTGCTTSPNEAECDDGSVCTLDDHCKDSACGGLPISCEDLDPCTKHGCDPVMGCTSEPAAGPCDDGNLCTIDDACSGGACVPGKAKDCDDQDPCTKDGCVATSIAECQHETLASCLDPVLIRGGFSCAGWTTSAGGPGAFVATGAATVVAAGVAGTDGARANLGLVPFAKGR
jgi:hypothetical protein